LAMCQASTSPLSAITPLSNLFQILCVAGCVDELSAFVTNEMSVILEKTVLHLIILPETLREDKILFDERRHHNYIQVSLRQVGSKINACIPRLVLIPISTGVQFKCTT